MKLGVVGNGMIVNRLLEDTRHLTDVEVRALCVREQSLDKGRQLADRYHIREIYTEYPVFLTRTDIDTVYIGIISSMHYVYAKEALKAGKNVICEKPFTTEYDEAKELIEIARKKKLFLWEACKIPYSRNFRAIKENLGMVGAVKLVQCNYSQYSSRYDAFKKGMVAPVFDAEKAGGALMDLNVYNIHFVTGLFGEPSDAHYYPNMERGVDTSGILVLEYPSFQCVCIAAKDCGAPLSVNIQGDRGCIFSHSNAGRFEEFSYQENKKESEHYALVKEDGPIFYDELRAFADYYEKDDREAFRERLSQSLRVMNVLDQAKSSVRRADA